MDESLRRQTLEHIPSAEMRTNALTGEKILVSPGRGKRPDQWKTPAQYEEDMPDYDPACYICPGNLRISGEINPDYTTTYVFPNDFPALKQDHHNGSVSLHEDFSDSPFFQSGVERGDCEVISYHPHHNVTISGMSLQEIKAVIRTWQNRFAHFDRLHGIKHVQIFENRGKEIGASLPHPHGQIWVQETIPQLPTKEAAQQKKYFDSHGTPLLADYLSQERQRKLRVVDQNEGFTTLVPFWAGWPYETLILPNRPITAVDQLRDDEVMQLAMSLSVVTRAYAMLFARPRYGADYTMGIHQRPTDGGTYPYVQLHFHIEPIHLTPEKIKRVIGYERFAQPQRDLTPEDAAASLRQSVQQLYKREEMYIPSYAPNSNGHSPQFSIK